MSSIGSPRTLIPLLATDSASSIICSFIYNGLLKYDKNLNLTGDLARSWEVLDNGRKIIFHLKKGIKWHDGVEFTAEDVRFTYQKLIDPKVITPYSSDFQRIKRLAVRGKYTVEVIYKEPFSPALSSWTMPIIPEHILKNEDLNTTSYARHPIGTGPYKFHKWSVCRGIVELTAFKDYFEGKPFVSRIVFRVIPDTATLFLEVLTQGVDNASLTPLQYLKHANTPLFRKHYRKFTYPSHGFLYMGYNLNNFFFRDKRVRQALNYAVDKNEIIKAVYLGQAEVSTGPFTRDSWAYDFNSRPAEFSPLRAKELLKQAGIYDSDSDGILDKNGRPFKFTIFTNQGNMERKMAAEIIQKRLADIGIKVSIRVVEWTVFIDRIIKKKKFDAVLLGWSLSQDPDVYSLFHSSQTSEGEFNFIGYKNPEVDELLVQARREFDKERRKELYYKVRRLIYDDQPYMFICSPYSLSCIHKRFIGVCPKKGGYWYNFIKWWVPKQKQIHITAGF